MGDRGVRGGDGFVLDKGPEPAAAQGGKLGRARGESVRVEAGADDARLPKVPVDVYGGDGPGGSDGYPKEKPGEEEGPHETTGEARVGTPDLAGRHDEDSKRGEE